MTSVRDIIIIAVLLFAVGITIVLVVNIGHRVNTNLLTVPTFNDTATAVAVIEHTDTAIDMTDYIYLALFVGFFLSIIITGWFVGGLPIAAPLYFFVVVIFTFVSIILQLAWNDIAANSSLLAASLAMPITSFILSHLGFFMAIFGLTGIILMFAKPGEGRL